MILTFPTPTLEANSETVKPAPRRVRMTKLWLQSLRAPKDGRVVYWDTDLRGLGLRVSAARPGDVRPRAAWVIAFRAKATGAAKQWVKIGALADIPDPAVARARARDALMSRRDGISLSGASSEVSNAPNGNAAEADLVRARVASVNNAFVMRLPLYLAYCEKTKRNRNLPETVADKDRRLTKHVIPQWGKRDISTITRKDVIRLFRGLAHVPGSAYQVYSMLNDFFKWAVDEEFVAINPMAGMGSPFKVGERDRCLSDDEIRWFWRACDELGWPVGFWGKMLLLTCQRCSEVSKMSRFSIDRHQVWTLRSQATKPKRPHIVHFSDFAKEILAQIPEVGQHNGHVFNGAKLNKTENKRQIDKLMLQFCKEEFSNSDAHNPRPAVIDPWVFHDLRRTGATIMARLKHDQHVVHKVLNHSDSEGANRGRAMLSRIYIVHQYLEEREFALQDLGEYIRRVITEKMEG